MNPSTALSGTPRWSGSSLPLLDEGDYALAAAELGMEVGPPEPFSHGAWFQSLATTLSDI
jgi:hypothetical protein